MRSESIVIFIDFGRFLVSCGSICRMLSAVEIMLVSGWR